MNREVDNTTTESKGNLRLKREIDKLKNKSNLEGHKIDNYGC